MKKFCQSCAMPLLLHGQDVRGREADGSLSSSYCFYYYKDGHFTEPFITYQDMLQKGKQAIAAGKGNVVVKWLMKLSYPYLLKKTNRWKSSPKNKPTNMV
ncbi:zinc ribbon domain-containing protein [Streptococcus pneumoniae]